MTASRGTYKSQLLMSHQCERQRVQLIQGSVWIGTKRKQHNDVSSKRTMIDVITWRYTRQCFTCLNSHRYVETNNVPTSTHSTQHRDNVSNSILSTVNFVLYCSLSKEKYFLNSIVFTATSFIVMFTLEGFFTIHVKLIFVVKIRRSTLYSDKVALMR